MRHFWGARSLQWCGPSPAAGGAPMLLTAEAERRYVRAIFSTLGAGDDEGDILADMVVEADLRGRPVHGLAGGPLAIALVETGVARVGAQPRIVQERDAVALMDGDSALGPYAATCAMR